jgi:hypothetical protein
MKVLLSVLAACVACLVPARTARGQSITTEAAATAGYSTDDVSAAAAQFRAFGDLKGGLRFFGEIAWARSSDADSDSFGAAYPYTNRLQIIEAYAERLFRPRGALLGIRAGRFRTPFGISSGSDHAYSGFLRAPLVRYEEYSPLSNYFLEHGADLVVGVPRLTVEAAVGAPADVGAAVRRPGLDTVVRVQGYHGALIVGASHIRTSPARSALVAPGRTDLTGIDVRWMHGGVQLRGEWMTGRPFDGTTSAGWYADVLVHRAFMGPVTAVARVEKLDDEGVREELDAYLRRQTFGARVRLPRYFSVNINVVHQTGGDEEYRPTALDVGLTWSIRSK